MTVLASNLLIAAVDICLRSQKIMLSIGYEPLMLLLALTAFRFLFPFAVSFWRIIYFTQWLSAAAAFLRRLCDLSDFRPVSAALLLRGIWLAGVGYRLCRFGRDKAVYLRFVGRYGKKLNRQEPYRTMMAGICGGRKNPIWIMRVPYYGVPMQYGTFWPYLLLPYLLELEREELYYVLCHETAHYYCHDNFARDVIAILCALYWWNPMCGLWKRRADLLFEMRVDDKLAGGDVQRREAYCRALRCVNEKVREMLQEPVADPFAVVFAPVSGKEDLQLRERMIYREKRGWSALSYLLAGIALAVCVCSCCLTWEWIVAKFTL